MQVILKQKDIELALRGYLLAQGINIKGKDVEIGFTAGRKEAGISAEINIVETGELQPAALVIQKISEESAVLPDPQPDVVVEEPTETPPATPSGSSLFA